MISGGEESLIRRLKECSLGGVAFEVSLRDSTVHRIGDKPAAFRLTLHNEAAAHALASLDELAIGTAYINGDISIEGDLVSAVALRHTLVDRHIRSIVWQVVLRPLLSRRGRRDEVAIGAHYDEDPEFFLLFLDKAWRCYSHGYFASNSEALETAVERKLDTALKACAVGRGARILDIGAGWGAFTEYAGRRGVQVTSLTISRSSERFVSERIRREALPCDVVLEHFLEHQPKEPYDAIVNLGVTEHLPDYDSTLEHYSRLLTPGGKVFLDACAGRRKHCLSSFSRAHVWPGNGTPMHLGGYIKAVERSELEVCAVANDRHNYHLTTQHWAQNLDSNREEIVRRWGEQLYRRFRLYLWGSCEAFGCGSLTAYRLVLRLPEVRFRRRRRFRRQPSS